MKAVSFLVILFLSVDSFQLQQTCYRDDVRSSKAASLTVSYCGAGNNNNPNDFESPQEREDRMRMVRQIQKSFYLGEGGDLVQALSDDDPTILTQVPLWRVQWTELPGYQNVLNVHVAHYTHMFRRILSGPKPWFFGHIYLPGGSENLDNPTYRLLEPNGNSNTENSSKATTVGTLMKVTDYKFLKDGRLTLIVQAMERFRVVEATQHVPYAIATIQRDPDMESILVRNSENDDSIGNNDNENKNLVAAAVEETLEWSDWEFRPTLWEQMTSTTTTTTGKEEGMIAVSPLINYDSDFFPNELLITSKHQSSTEQDELEQILKKLECKIWVSLDALLRLLSELNPGLSVPVPSQLLGLLPTLPAAAWPEGFQLEEYATKLQQNNAVVGTGTKSPFVRVSENYSYPILRRAARLSYAIWIILESIQTQGSPSKQDILEETSIAKRLQLASTQLDFVNNALRQALPES
mmetsp:Transcript_7690/g.10071  ORF Transcript_7690/g.10071 Transcript_7690/m.10071 type:complete len:465 (+) Transcript_7690:103-1497(+)|eukprot:CAMPEP_0198145210 /NCGR_PEP_ID=MMETSP1443-20131203/21913_1 /TAXON_ID=186043 /ORGANISM="Entomoneis sp., Strain CCMP2396" /LENGTH=464 /DNA_ID=CAMNT_0043808779 /DNA_START=27 /DNA_END=1421 /DNA_ORIENTATION=+